MAGVRIQAARKESTIFMRDAFTAGRNPPTKPIASENNSVNSTTFVVRMKPNASCENDWKFIVEIVIVCRKAAHTRPANPPTRPSNSDSVRNATSIDGCLKPSARKVPISAVRIATEEYMVIAAPIIAPTEKMTERKIPRNEMNVDKARDWSS